MNFSKIDISALINRRKSFLLLSILTAIFFTTFAPYIKTVNNVDYFKIDEDPDEIFYNNHKKVFGNDEFFTISFKKDDIFTYENLKLLQTITNQLEETDLPRDVISLTNTDDIIGEEDYFYIAPLVEKIPKERNEIEKLRKRALDNSFLKDNLISSDSKTTAILVFTKESKEDSNYRQKLLTKTREILSRHNQNTKFHLAGWTVTNYSLSQYMLKDLTIFIPATYLLIALATLLFFRNLRLTMLAMATITCCLGSTAGVYTLIGAPLNNVTIIVIPLIMALSLADTVHIFTHMKKSTLGAAKNKYEAMKAILNQVAVPCTLTTVTTIIGFLSLLTSDLQPIKQFALLSSAGMALELFFSFLFLPQLTLLFNPEKTFFEEKKSQYISKNLSRISHFNIRNFKSIILASFFILTCSILLAINIKIETNLIDFFKPSSLEQQDLKFVEENLTGVGSLNISFKSEKIDTFKKPENLAIIEKVENFVSSLDGVDKTLSFNYLIKEMNKSFHNENDDYYTIPESSEEISQYLLLYDSRDIDDFINNEYNHTQIMVRLGIHNTSKYKELITKIESYLIENFSKNKGIEIRITGQALQEANTVDTLVIGQLKSITVATILIFLLMFLFIRSLSISLISILPNILPIIINFAIMTILNIPLNTATTLISAVALGIAVDDTIHFLTYYQEQLKKGTTNKKAVEMTIINKGSALISSSFILCIGFGVLTLSNFMPVYHFGLLSAIIMITALTADIFLLPSLLLCRKSLNIKAT